MEKKNSLGGVLLWPNMQYRALPTEYFCSWISAHKVVLQSFIFKIFRCLGVWLLSEPNKIYITLILEDTGMFVLLLCDCGVTGVMWVMEGLTCQGSWAALKMNHCYVSCPTELRKLLLPWRMSQNIHVEPTTEQLWLIILTILTDTNPLPAVCSQPRVLLEFNLLHGR